MSRQAGPPCGPPRGLRTRWSGRQRGHPSEHARYGWIETIINVPRASSRLLMADGKLDEVQGRDQAVRGGRYAEMLEHRAGTAGRERHRLLQRMPSDEESYLEVKVHPLQSHRPVGWATLP